MENQHTANKNKRISPRRSKREWQVGEVFVLLVGGSAAACTLIYAIFGNGRFADGFFLRGGDFFMDFFNSLRDAAQGSGVYSERGVIYPPMANLIFLLLSRFVPSVYADSSFAARRCWALYDECLLLLLVVLVFCVAALLLTLFLARREGTEARRLCFATVALLGVPLLHLLERGNIILLCFVAMMVYAFTYNSQSKLWREVGLVCLGFAFSLKLYPVVFGWQLIADRRYRDAARCALYGFLMLLIPSFFFGGPIFCLVQVLENIFGFSTGTGNTVTKVMAYLGISPLIRTIMNALAYVWVLICGVGFAVSAYLRKEKVWKTWTLGLVTILCIPSLTGMYNWAFFLIPLIMLANRARASGREWVGVWLMMLPFAHLPFRFSLHVAPSDVLVYVMTAALSVFSVLDLWFDILAYRRAKNRLDKPNRVW